MNCRIDMDPTQRQIMTAQLPYRTESTNELSHTATVPAHCYVPSSRRVEDWKLVAKLGVAAIAFVIVPVLFLPSGVEILSLGIGLWVILLAALWIRKRQLAQGRAVQEATGLLQSGQLDAAAAALDDLLQQRRYSGLLHAIMVYTRGVVFLRQGFPQRARELFVSVEKADWFTRKVEQRFDVALACSGAVAEAVLGHVSIASAKLEAIRPHVSLLDRGRLLHAQIVTTCREARYHDVLTLIDEHWRVSEGSLSAAQIRALRMLEAFAAAQQVPTQTARVQEALALARGIREEDFGYLLAGGWAELERFANERGLLLHRATDVSLERRDERASTPFDS